MVGYSVLFLQFEEKLLDQEISKSLSHSLDSISALIPENKRLELLILFSLNDKQQTGLW